MSLIDDYLRKFWVYLLKNKSNVFAKFKKWKAEVENQTSRKVKCLTTDNSTEYMNKEFLRSCEEHGSMKPFKILRTPQKMKELRGLIEYLEK